MIFKALEFRQKDPFENSRLLKYFKSIMSRNRWFLASVNRGHLKVYARARVRVYKVY